MEKQEEIILKNKIDMIRAITRSLGLLIPLIAVCVGIFVISDVRDTLLGGIIGSLGTAGIFYYEGKI